MRGVPDGVRVFDAQGDLVEAAATVSGAELTVALPEPLGEGTTVVVWRVVSEDGHPISGSLTFSVGAPTSDFTPPPADTAGTPDVPLTLTLARWVGYVGLFLAAGLVAFVVLFLPVSRDVDGVRRRLVVGSRIAALVASVGWLATLPLTAVYLLDGGASLPGRSSTWSSLPVTEYVVPALVVAGLALAVLLLGHGLPAGPRRVGALAAAGIAAAAPALTGHTRASSPELLVVATDVLHLLAGSVWLGGLAGLALALPGLADRGALAAEVLARFSTAAAGVLAALVATGAVLAWRILGSWSGFVDTTYGRLLLVKIGIAAVAVAIAAWNRWSLLPRLRQAATQDTRAAARPVVRATAVEAVVLVAVLLVTGFLVDKSPEGDPAPASAAAEGEPGTQSATLGEIDVEATLAPLTRGPNTLTIRLTTPTGEPTEGVAPPVVRLASDRVVLGAVRSRPCRPASTRRRRAARARHVAGAGLVAGQRVRQPRRRAGVRRRRLTDDSHAQQRGDLRGQPGRELTRVEGPGQDPGRRPLGGVEAREPVEDGQVCGVQRSQRLRGRRRSERCR